MDPMQPLYPRWYKPNARWEFHGGAIGHSVDNCIILRNRVHALSRNGWLKIEASD